MTPIDLIDARHAQKSHVDSQFLFENFEHPHDPRISAGSESPALELADGHRFATKRERLQ